MYYPMNIISDIPGFADYVDANTVNPWGAFYFRSKLYVANNGGTTMTIYDDDGIADPTVINIPAGTTGTLWYTGPGAFHVSNGTTSGIARIIGVTEAGEIWGWNRVVDPLNAYVVYTNPDSSYKGCDLDYVNNHLVITDFKNGHLKIFDDSWTEVSSTTDQCLLDINYSLFYAYVNDGKIYVTFGLRDAANHDAVAGQGNGFIDVFRLNGTYSHRFANQSHLNAPWGMVRIYDCLYVGNFGNGTILSYDIGTGQLGSVLTDCCGNTLYFQGLWALVYVKTDEYDYIFVTAGINDEANGLVARLEKCKCKKRRKCRVYDHCGVVVNHYCC